MSKRIHFDPMQRTWKDYPGELPKPLQILVFRTGRKSSPTFHAMCVQFSGIDARGATEVEAVNEALDILMHYLYDWHESNGKGKPTRKVDQVYRDAFDFGHTRSDILKQLRESPPVRVLVRRETGEQDAGLLIREASNARELAGV